MCAEACQTLRTVVIAAVQDVSLDCNKSGSCSGIAVSNHSSVPVALTRGFVATARTIAEKAW